MKFPLCYVLPDKKFYGKCLYWCKYVRDFDGAPQWLKATVPDRRIWLPTPACVDVAVRLSKARTQRGQAICSSARPASTEDCTSGNETRTQNACAWAWSRTKSLLPVTTLVQIRHCTIPNNTDHPQLDIHRIYCIEKFFTIQDFWETCTCPEKQSCPENFHCIEYIFYHSGFLNNFALYLKNRVYPQNFHCFEYTFYIQDFWAICACPEERVFPEFTVLNIQYMCFIIQEFWETCACPEKQSLTGNFSLYWKFFHRSGFLSDFAFALKNRVCPENFRCIQYTFYIQDFWATCACPEKQFALNTLNWIYIFFIIQEFLINLRLPWKQSVPWIHCVEYIFFIIQDFSATWACPEKQSCPEIFHWIEIFFIIQDFWAPFTCPEFTVLNIHFLSFRIFEQLALAPKTEFALKFFKLGVLSTPASYAYENTFSLNNTIAFYSVNEWTNLAVSVWLMACHVAVHSHFTWTRPI